MDLLRIRNTVDEIVLKEGQKDSNVKGRGIESHH